MGNPRKTHGHKPNKGPTPTYRVWTQMRARCRDLSNIDYGGRGIKVCERWKHSFENFLEDMGTRPECRTLDRIDMNGNYEKSNCRWATVLEQGRNKRNNIVIEIDGVKKCLSEWAEMFGVPFATAYLRRRRGWDEIKAVSEPLQKGELHFSKRNPEKLQRGEEKFACKLTDEKARSIYSRYWDGNVSQQKLADEHGVSAFTVSQICRGKKWAHATKEVA